jgi:hypothetical protein
MESVRVSCGKRIKNVMTKSMQGKFYKHKTGKHAHTNACKAALNMITRTSVGSDQ